ncbi:MAG: FG-GAP-like repeat-containing protein, partial [Pyrinomonadaceae bacterium]
MFRLKNNFQYVFAFVLGTLLVLSGCRSGTTLPDKSSKAYRDVVSAFYVGVAALQVGDDVRADSRLTQVTQLVPDEPAGWANLGVLALRQRKFDSAAARLERARTLAPDNAEIHYLMGLLESSRGQSADAISKFQKAIELDPRHLKAIYALAGEIERQSLENSEAEYQSLMQKILAAQPDNLAAQLELARVAAKRGDLEAARSMINQIISRSALWPAEVQKQLATVQSAVTGADARAVATQITFLRNVMVRVPEYRKSLALIKPPPGEEATPFTRLLKLESPTFTSSAADTALSFKQQPTTSMSGNWQWVAPFYSGGAGAPTMLVSDGREVRLTSGEAFAFPGGPTATAPLPEGVLPIDFNYDFKTDLVLAGRGGLRLMRQDADNTFSDATNLTKLPGPITSASYLGAWAADIEADGDLDIVLGVENEGARVLRNNGDGTFIEINPFANITGIRGFVWADLDADGDPDAALIDGAGRLRVLSNERTG